MKTKDAVRQFVLTYINEKNVKPRADTIAIALNIEHSYARYCLTQLNHNNSFVNSVKSEPLKIKEKQE